jgi:hypothetical protein
VCAGRGRSAERVASVMALKQLHHIVLCCATACIRRLPAVLSLVGVVEAASKVWACRACCHDALVAAVKLVDFTSLLYI